MTSISVKDVLNKLKVDKLKSLASNYKIQLLKKSPTKNNIIESIVEGYRKLPLVEKNQFDVELGMKQSSPIRNFEVEERRAGARAMDITESKSSRGELPEETTSKRGLQMSPSAKSSRRIRAEKYDDVSAKSSRRYLLPARLPGFRNFLCNMLEYRGEMKGDMPFYPIGYISYLLRAYSYDTSSITPINIADDQDMLKDKNSIELDDAINFPDKVGYRARYVKEKKNNMVFPATIIYKPEKGLSCIYMTQDMFSMVASTKQRYIIVFIREIVVDDNDKDNVKIDNDTYLPVVIDQKRKTIDVIPEFSERLMADKLSARLMEETRNEALQDLIDLKEYKDNIRIYQYSSEAKKSNPKVWQIMMVHLKLINQVASFDEVSSNFLAELEKQNKDINAITYSYFMKIMRLSVNEQIDHDLLYIFHGSD